LYNPLPEALKHYEGALLDVLSAAGVPARSAGAPSIEVHGASKWQRARAAAAELAAHRRAGRGGHLIVLWPTYGLLEPALWLPSWRAGRVSIVIHDPSPLRRQLGMGPVAASLGGRAARASHLRVVAHSETAADTLRANLQEALRTLKFQSGAHHISAVTSETSPLREQSGKCAVKILERHDVKFPDNLIHPGESYSGAPVLRVNIEENGETSHIQLLQTSGIRRLDAMLVSNVRQWKYAPRSGCGIIQANVVFNVDWVAADSGATSRP